MSARRALVDCAVLSLQDACVFYPCCKGCFSRIDVEQQDTARCRCSKCGYSCVRELVDYRYRLSLKVSRDGCIFGVTVFGTSLNPFFGINASGLHRLVENLDEPVEASTRATLLLKAVEDCFIGRHFIFGIKVTEPEGGPWLGAPVTNRSGSKDTVQIIANQITLPKASGFQGCTVASYYRILLQKAAEYDIGLTDPTKTCQVPATPLLLIPQHSSAGSVGTPNDTRRSSGLFPQSILRSQYQDCTLSPTPPWQQSLGLVTSSAEQEEDCGGDEHSRETHSSQTLNHAQRGCPVAQEVTEKTVQSARPSFAKHSQSQSIEKAVGNNPILQTSPSPLGLNSSKLKDFSSSRLTETCLETSVDWENLPFSESLSEFLLEENKDFGFVSEIRPRRNETTRNKVEIKSQDKKSSIQIADRHSRTLLDISSTPAVNGGDGQDVSERVCESPAGHINNSLARYMCPHEYKQTDEKGSSLSFDNEEEPSEEDTYNCSADLFSSSFLVDVTNKPNALAKAVRTTTEAFPVLWKPEQYHLRSEKAHLPLSTPHKRKLKSEKFFKRDSLIPPGIQELDFIPPSQSTPIVKAEVVSDPSYRTSSRDSSAFYSNASKLDSKRPRDAFSLNKLNCVSPHQLCQRTRDSTREDMLWSVTPGRHSCRVTPKRRFCRPVRNKQPHLRVHGGALNTGSAGRIKCEAGDGNVAVCDQEDGTEVLVPPTPAAKTHQSATPRRRRQTDNGGGTLGLTFNGQQGDAVNYNRDRPQTGHCDSKTADEENLDASDCFLLDPDNKACDWSRDLFSDSI